MLAIEVEFTRIECHEIEYKVSDPTTQATLLRYSIRDANISRMGWTDRIEESLCDSETSTNILTLRLPTIASL